MRYEKDLPVGGECDLLVAGGGMAGVACALAAARRGLRVTLVERGGCLGGMATAGGVHILLGGRRYDAGQDQILRTQGGLFDEITDAMIARGWAVDPETVDLHHFNPYGWYPRMAAGICCDIDRLKVLLDALCLQANVDVRLYTDCLDGLRSGDGRLDTVVLRDRSGLYALRAALYVDCTGNADLVHACGLPTLKGREEDGGVAPSTLCFFVDNVDTPAYVGYQNAHQSPKLVEIIERLQQAGEWPFNVNIFIAIQTPQTGVFLINTLRQTGVDGTDSASLTRATQEGRRQSLQLLGLMQKHFPGFANARLQRISDVMGIRESRRIDARHRITLEDALAGQHYPDCVATTTYNFDLPDPNNPSVDAMMGDVRNPTDARRHVRIEIPYRALLPKGIPNLMVAGRSLGADRDVMGACRVMGPCTGMGQAAGNAAALALNTADFGQVDTNQLREDLIAQGVLNL